MQRIAVLTSGGDAPGMNAAVVAVARSAAHEGMSLIGVIRGYNGLIRKDRELLRRLFERAHEVVEDTREDRVLLAALERASSGEMGGSFPDFSAFFGKYREQLCLAEDFGSFMHQFPSYQKDFVNLDIDTVLDIADQPGTHLRTARCKEFLDPVVRLTAMLNLVALGIDGLIVIGGDGSFQGALMMSMLGMPCVGIPGTIDNDLAYTEMTLGYDTAVNVCATAVRQIRATSRSHDRPHVVEVMGRNCGDIALRTAVSTGAEIVVVPEVPWSIEETAKRLQKELDLGNTRATVIVAEGAYESMAPFDVYGFLMERGKQCYPGEGISANRLASVLKRMCHDANGQPVEVRSTVLGYIQRGDSPSSYDAAFAFEAGNRAVKLLQEGEGNQAIAVKEGRVVSMPITVALNMQSRRRDQFNTELYTIINTL